MDRESLFLKNNQGAGKAAASDKTDKEYEIDIFRDWCKDCGICAAFCPWSCIKMNEAGEPVVEKA